MSKYTMEEPRFSSMDLCEGNNIPDLLKSIANGDMIGIVDDNDGGIIAYAIGQDHANVIVDALRKTHNTY